MFRIYLVLVLLTGAYNSHIKDVAAASSVLSANLGDDVTLKCSHPSSTSYISWYQQTAGEKPRLISFYYTSASNLFYNEFKNNSRFSLDPEEGLYHLKISNAQQSDSAMYYCGTSHINRFQFVSGIFLNFKESNSRPVLQQPVSESVQPGDSGTLNCSVHTGTCDGEHSVYWLRHDDSGDGRLGIMYAHGERSGRCQTRSQPGFPKQSCSVYSLPKRNLSPSDAGLYDCAVASCGEILFGNETRVGVGGSQNGHLVLLCCLGAALTVSFVLNIVLACVLCRTSRRICLQYGGTRAQLSAPAHISEDEDADRLQYAALNFNKKATARRQKSTEEKETVYSGLRCQNVD